MTEPEAPDLAPVVSQALESFEQAHTKWEKARQAAAEAAANHKAAARQLAKTDSQLAVHLQHRDLVIEESGVTQLRGTFRLSRRLLTAGALLTTIGAMIFALGLPLDQPSPDETISAMSFTSGVPAPDEGDAVVVQIVGLAGDTEECGERDLEAVLVSATGDLAEVVVIDEAAPGCMGRWLLPAGTWHVVSGREPEMEKTPADENSPDP